MQVKPVVLIFAIIAISFLIKVSQIDTTYYFDNFEYYERAIAFANYNTLDIENNQYFHNIGYPLIQGLIFKIVPHSFYNHIIFSIVFSSIGLCVAYLFFKRFLPWHYCIIGVCFLALNFRMIQNSVQGISEPLFLLFVWSCFYLAIREKRFAFVSLVLSIFTVIIRFEGLVVVGFCLWQFISKYQSIKQALLSFLILPVIGISKILNYNTIEDQGDILTEFGTIGTHLKHEIFVLSHFIRNDAYDTLAKTLNSFVYFGWSLFPEFLFLIPFGTYSILIKKRIGKSLLIWSVLFGGVGMWAYLDAYDTRYFFLSYLFIDLICLYGIKEIIRVIWKKRLTK